MEKGVGIMDMVQATQKDFKVLYQILLECSNWLKSKGVPQWEKPYPAERFKSDIESGHVYYFVKFGQIVGMATIQTAKPDYYPDNLFDDIKVWYVCRVAVPRKMKNRFLGQQIFEVIQVEEKKSGIAALRIDIAETNPFLLDYYGNFGFVELMRGTIFNKPTIFMEKRF